jgi:uncharacterized protein (TIGR02118 family)
MVKISVFYPREEGKHFDIEYYCKRHIPMVQKLCGNALRSASVERGLSGMTPGSPAAYLAMGHLLFDSVEDFQASFDPHLGPIVGDVPNYTNSEPVIQISEVKL